MVKTFLLSLSVRGTVPSATKIVTFPMQSRSNNRCLNETFRETCYVIIVNGSSYLYIFIMSPIKQNDY